MIFIAGNSRSGTTLMGRILGKHPDVFTFNELHYLEEMWMPADETSVMTKVDAINNFAKLLSIQREGYLKKRQTGNYFNEATQAIESFANQKISFAFLYESFLKYETAKNNKKISCEKTPRNVLYISELLKIYPASKIICMIRDPKDVLLSQKKKWKRRFLGASASIPLKESIRARINYHPFLISKLWNTNAQEVSNHKNHSNIKVVKFEELLLNPEKEVQAICSFLQIPFTGEMLKVEQKGSSVAFDNTSETNIDNNKTGHWKQGLNKTEIYICEKITAQQRRIFQYDDTGIAPDYFMYTFYLLIFPFQLLLAFIINAGRTKNIFHSIKKRFA